MLRITRTLSIIAAALSLTAAIAAADASDPPTTEPMRRLGSPEFRLTAKDASPRPFRFSPDGKLFAGADWDQLRIWSFPDGKLLHDFSGQVKTRCIAFNADGSELWALHEPAMEIHRFDVASGKPIGTTKLADVVEEEGAATYTFSNNGRWLASTEVYGHLTAWDASNGKRLLREQLSSSNTVRISDAGVLTIVNPPWLDRYDLNTGKLQSRSRITDRPAGQVSNPQGTLFAGYSKEHDAVVFWDPEKDEIVGGKVSVDRKEWQPNQAALSEDGRRFVYRTEGGGNIVNREIAVYDVPTGDRVAIFALLDYWHLGEPVISPDGRFVFPADGRTFLRPVDIETGQPLHDTPEHVLPVDVLSFTPNGNTLLTGGRDGPRAWDVESGKYVNAFDGWDYPPYIIAVDDQRAIVSGRRHGGLRLVSIDDGAVERRFDAGDKGTALALQLSPDSTTFVATTQQPRGHLVRRWNIATGKVEFEGFVPQPASNDGRRSRYSWQELPLGGSRLLAREQVRRPDRLPDGSIDWGMELHLVDWTTQAITNRLPLPANGRFNVAKSASETTLAAVITDGYIPPAGQPWGSSYFLVWDIPTQQEQVRITRAMDNYFAAFDQVAITLDARIAATSSYRDRIEIWDGNTGDLLQTIPAGVDVTALAFSDDGRILASGHADGRVSIWDSSAAWQKAKGTP